jgi:hypothetical protein
MRAAGVRGRLRGLWARDTVRLLVLTVYYTAIIAGLVRLHGGSTLRPPPFIYQAF